MPPSHRPPVTVAGRQLDLVLLEESGREPTLVFLHEGLGSIELWRSYPQSVVASTGHRGLMYSRSDHGWSAAETGHRPLDFFDREALDVLPSILEGIDASAPILIGHSDGASIALVYAAHLEAAGLVLLAPHVFVEEHGLREIADVTARWPDGDLEKRMAKYHRDPAVTFFAWSDFWLNPEFATWDIRHLLGDITCPILVVQGLDDPYGTVAHLDAIEAGVSGPVEKLVLEACGHSPHLSQPEKTLEATVRFVRDVSK